jgi:hypothetical protein
MRKSENQRNITEIGSLKKINTMDQLPTRLTKRRREK